MEKLCRCWIFITHLHSKQTNNTREKKNNPNLKIIVLNKRSDGMNTLRARKKSSNQKGIH